MYWLRVLGGALYLVGAILCGVNCLKTMAARPAQYAEPVQEAPPLSRDYVEPPKPESRLEGAAVLSAAHWMDKWSQLWWHHRWERLPVRFTIWVTVAVIVASLFEIIPTFLIRTNDVSQASVEPYTPLELYGRDIYISEGCYNCHSQMIRPILSETKRFGSYSEAGEFVYDHPFQWGSRRIGPDLAREGGKQSPYWHVVHFKNPKQLIEGSIMPPYPWLLTSQVQYNVIQPRMRAMQTLGVPYTDEQIDGAVEAAEQQAQEIAKKVLDQDASFTGLDDKDVVALIAYLDRLGVKAVPSAAEQDESASDSDLVRDSSASDQPKETGAE
jgi:cytochrome c oxidase cbb3-type subunit I/II